MLRASVALSTLAYDVLWQHHNLGDKPNALNTPSPGTTHEERAVLEHRAWTELEHTGLLHRGRIDEDLRDALEVLAHPTDEVYGWINQAHREDYTALAALHGDAAILAVLINQVLHLHPIRPTALAESLVSALPEVPPARGRSVTLPADYLAGRRPAEPDDDWFEEVRPADTETTDYAREVLALPRISAGQLHVATRDRLGRRHRTLHPVAFIDTSEGRWMAQRRPTRGNRPWAVIAPADRRLLVARLNEMRAIL
ncbi:ESX secretion-associated protein EspG [Longimycelium tulufanense]|uniref:ESX secretion-associated protein EspG n=1 Tax=Longimycelium tulufanense TaxID=907463 RepID=A0A8J3FTI2_9PSEU|nr:ESX secretion-associated protein EspG [Longimycelium tulufanense]GGM34461.1 ESX secretion-associated protein EspG [Longimycelium tulufanense]